MLSTAEPRVATASGTCAASAAEVEDIEGNRGEKNPLSPIARGCPSALRGRLQARLDLVERCRVFDGGQIAWIAAFRERLNGSAQQFAGARFRQQRHEMH